ncbi:conserved protein of unknown function [Agreia sp. COWG]|nr:conserved protein of unknown function [Agreia sp. COWG]
MRGWVLDHIDQRRRRRRRLTIVGAGVVTVTALSAAAWIVVASQQVQERQVFCYSAPDVNSQIAEGERYSGDELGDPQAHALSMCDALWNTGVLGSHPTVLPTQGPQGYPVPDLTLCVRPNRSLAVFPDADGGFCEANGMTVATTR